MKATPSIAYKEFERLFSHANTWAERKDGVPLEFESSNQASASRQTVMITR